MLDSFVKKLSRPFADNGSINIVCLGDSVTQGCFSENEDDASKAYPLKIRKMLNFFYPNQIFNVINSGIGGTTAAFAVSRFERDVLKYDPDLVLIMFGVNDFSNIDLYINSLEKMFTELNEKGIPAIYITEHMMNTYVAKHTAECHLEYAAVTAEKQNGGTMDEVFARGKEIAAKHSIPVCDIYSIWKNLQANGVDTTHLLSNAINHPCPEMHTLLAYEILRMILM